MITTGLLICNFLLVVNCNQPLISQILSFNEIRVTTLTFRVIAHIADMQFPISGPLKPSLYLALLWTYYVSNI